MRLGDESEIKEKRGEVEGTESIS